MFTWENLHPAYRDFARSKRDLAYRYCQNKSLPHNTKSVWLFASLIVKLLLIAFEMFRILKIFETNWRFRLLKLMEIAKLTCVHGRLEKIKVVHRDHGCKSSKFDVLLCQNCSTLWCRYFSWSDIIFYLHGHNVRSKFGFVLTFAKFGRTLSDDRQ